MDFSRWWWWWRRWWHDVVYINFCLSKSHAMMRVEYIHRDASIDHLLAFSIEMTLIFSSYFFVFFFSTLIRLFCVFVPVAHPITLDFHFQIHWYWLIANSACMSAISTKLFKPTPALGNIPLKCLSHWALLFRYDSKNIFKSCIANIWYIYSVRIKSTILTIVLLLNTPCNGLTHCTKEFHSFWNERFTLSFFRYFFVFAKYKNIQYYLSKASVSIVMSSNGTTRTSQQHRIHSCKWKGKIK